MINPTLESIATLEFINSMIKMYLIGYIEDVKPTCNGKSVVYNAIIFQ
jgi:hypothetical protein